MKFTKLNNKSDENFFTEFKSWLQSDLSLVNKTIFENLNNDSTLISDLSNHIINAGGKFVDIPCIEDGNLITSPHYKYNGEWMKLVISKLKN